MMVYDPNTGKYRSVVNWKAIRNIWIFFIIMLVLDTWFKEETITVLAFIIKIIASILGVEVKG